MSSNIAQLPPPWPNAALALSKLAGNVQLQERIDRSSENAPIKTSFPDPVQSAETNADTLASGQADSGKKGVDVSV